MNRKKFLGVLIASLVCHATAQAATLGATVGVIDFDAPSTFFFSFSTPIAPLTGPVSWSADVSGILTDSSGIDGVSAAPSGGSIFEFLVDGVAIATDALGTLNASFADSYGGIYNCGAGCTSLGMQIHFVGSGGGDIYSMTGNFSVVAASVPEPGVLAMFGIGLAGLGFMRRRTL